VSERKAIFIRNPKCATISIRGVFQHNDRGVRIDELEAHQRAHQWKDTIRDFDNHFVFSVCRNPYDRLLSGWLFICRRRLDKHKDILKKYGTNFTDFVLNLEADFGMQLTEVDMVTWPQHKWFLDQKGNNLVNEIGRFESLNEWWLDLCKRRGWSQQPLPKRNTTKHGPWRDYYNPAMYKIVNQQYKKDFELFNYKVISS
jgi:hypothetical protein